MQEAGKGFKIVLIPGCQMMSDEKCIAALLHFVSNAPVFHKVCKFVHSTAYSKYRRNIYDNRCFFRGREDNLSPVVFSHISHTACFISRILWNESNFQKIFTRFPHSSFCDTTTYFMTDLPFSIFYLWKPQSPSHSSVRSS